ncbi:MAG: hypothetical protein KUG77_10135 [Nannocystaceae bacterium]|nr:hypothetical protein [Nannocystaceae bacterium]
MPSAVAAPTLTPIETHTELRGPTTWSQVSGYTGPRVNQLGARHRKRALGTIRWWEDSDEPCKFWVTGKDVTGNGTGLGNAKRANFQTEFCRGNTNGDQLVVGAHTEHEFLTGLQVCVTDKNNTYKNKLKGIRVFSRMYDQSQGTLSGENDPVERKLKHCKKWSQKVSCPAGKVVTQIKLYSRLTSDDGDEEHGYARGIAIGCREIHRITAPVAR